MKRIFALLLALMLLIPSALADGTTFARDLAVVNNSSASGRLNMRETPDMSGAVIGQFYNGTFVTVVSYPNDQWVEVEVAGQRGYMMRSYLQFDPVNYAVKATAPTMTVRNLNGKGLNLRTAPYEGDGSGIIALFANGTTVTLIGTVGSWSYVQIGGMTGFVLSSALVGDVAANTTTTYSNWNDGPVGAHATADWTLNMAATVATVKNPDAADRLHLRRDASSKSSSLGKYYNGVRVIVLGTEGEFTRVGIGSDSGYRLEGYMKTEFLDFGNATKSAMPEITVKISRGKAKLYTMRSTDSAVMGEYENGTKCALMGFSGSWAHVLVDGKIGFMQIKNLK